MKLIATSPSFSRNKKLQNEVYKYFPDSKLNLDGLKFRKRELIDFIQEADALIVGLDNIDDEVLNHCKNLKILSKYGVGLNNVDLDACEKRKIHIGWTAGVNRLSVAEMALGIMLMQFRNIYVTAAQMRDGNWNKMGGVQLTGKTIGIIGVGHIGKEVIRLLEPFKCRILVNDIVEQDDYYEAYGLIYSSKETIFRESDVVTIHTPYDVSTKNLLNLKTFKMMKNTAYLLNTARGGIVNENDLKFALKNNLIAGAAIDVYKREPPADNELLRLPNIICTPHIGGNAKEAVEAMGMSAIGHIKKFFNL